MTAEIKRFDIHPDKRLRNRLGRFAVPCEVSGRWLQFESTSEKTEIGEMLHVAVMTGAADESRKLCDVIIRKEDLLSVLHRIEPKSQD